MNNGQKLYLKIIDDLGSAITDSGFLSTTSLNGSSGSPNNAGRNFSSDRFFENGFLHKIF